MKFFLLTIGSFLLTLEFFTYSCVCGFFLFAVRALLLTIEVLLITVEFSCLQWEIASINRSTNSKQKNSTASEKLQLQVKELPPPKTGKRCNVSGPCPAP